MSHVSYWALLIVLATHPIAGILIRSVELRSPVDDKTVIILHDMHYAEASLVTHQLSIIEECMHKNQEALILLEAPSDESAGKVHSINTMIADLCENLKKNQPSLPAWATTYLQTQAVLKTLEAQPLLSKLSTTDTFNTKKYLDNRAILLALSDLIALFLVDPYIAPTVQISINDLLAAIDALELQFHQLKPVIERLPKKLLTHDYESWETKLKIYRQALTTISNPTQNIFECSVLPKPLLDFFSWVPTSETFINLLLEAAFIEAVEHACDTYILIITGAYHADRIQTALQHNGFILEHDSGIMCNGTITYQSYAHIVANLLTANFNHSTVYYLQKLIASIKPLDSDAIVKRHTKKTNAKTNVIEVENQSC